MITRKGQVTRDRILAAAAALVYERGVAGTSTEDVQAAACVSASQLYHYFADKRSLTRAVIDYQADAILGFQESMLMQLDSLAALRSWAATIVDMQRGNGFRGGCPLGSLGSELAENDSSAREDLAAAYRRWHDAIRAGLGGLRDRGGLVDSADVDRLAMGLLTSLQGGLLLAQVMRDGEPLQTALSTAIDHIATFAAER
jgi:TetR/AcrR family transcriptional repressor of nem operon